MFPRALAISAIFFTILLLFYPTKFPRHTCTLVANNLSAETKSGHVFHTRPIASPQFCYFCGKERHSKIKFAYKLTQLHLAKFCN